MSAASSLFGWNPHDESTVLPYTSRTSTALSGRRLVASRRSDVQILAGAIDYPFVPCRGDVPTAIDAMLRRRDPIR
jgi:hypothetical protein